MKKLTDLDVVSFFHDKKHFKLLHLSGFRQSFAYLPFVATP